MDSQNHCVHSMLWVVWKRKLEEKEEFCLPFCRQKILSLRDQETNPGWFRELVKLSLKWVGLRVLWCSWAAKAAGAAGKGDSLSQGRGPSKPKSQLTPFLGLDSCPWVLLWLWVLAELWGCSVSLCQHHSPRAAGVWGWRRILPCLPSPLPWFCAGTPPAQLLGFHSYICKITSHQQWN